MNLRSHRLYLIGLFVLLTAGSAFAQFVDIGVSKSGPASAAAGTDVSYDVFVFNSGSADAASVTLDDPIPSGMTFVSASQNSGIAFSCSTPAGGATSGSVTCTAPLLQPGENADFTITLHIPPGATPGTTFLNVATVSTTSGDGNSENDSSAAGTTVPSTAADVGVSKSGPSAAPPGANITYTITVANGSPNDAQTVSLTDTLPGSMTFVSLAQSGPTFTCTTPSAGAGGTISCSIATLPSGAATTFTLVGNIPGGTPAGTTFQNTVNISSADDPDPENDSASSTVTISSVDVSVTKSGPPTATGGQDITYILGIANAGPDAAANAKITDVLPPGTTFVSLAQNTGPTASCTTPFAGFTGTVQCGFVSLASGASATFTLVIHVGLGVANGSTLTNTATASTDSFDSNAGNDSASTSATVTAIADMGVTKSGPATVVAGSTASYTLTVTNGGPSDASNAQLSDTLPASTTFVSFTQNTGPTAACTTPVVGSAGTVTCSWTPLASGASATFTLVVQTSPGAAAGSLANTATVSTTANDPNPANNSSTSTATLSSVADLGVTKTGPATIVAGNNAAYTITVTNGGPSDAAAAQFTDALPASTTFVSLNQSSGPSASCTTPAVGGTGSVTCSWASLVNGSTAVFTLTVKTDPNTAPGPLTNTATVTTTSTDPNSANNSSTSTANVVLSDVGITKSIPPAPFYIAGQPITFTLDVTNNAAQPASGIVVTDTLPAGMTLVSTTPAGACSGTTTITCNAATLAPGQTTTFTITATLPSTAGPVTNTASVTTATGDANPANDSSSVTFTVVPATAIPTLSPLMMALIALAFTAIALRAGRA